MIRAMISSNKSNPLAAAASNLYQLHNFSPEHSLNARGFLLNSWILKNRTCRRSRTGRTDQTGLTGRISQTGRRSRQLFLFSFVVDFADTFAVSFGPFGRSLGSRAVGSVVRRDAIGFGQAEEVFYHFTARDETRSSRYESVAGGNGAPPRGGGHLRICREIGGGVGGVLNCSNRYLLGERTERLLLAIHHFEMRYAQSAKFLADNFRQRVHCRLGNIRHAKRRWIHFIGRAHTRKDRHMKLVATLDEFDFCRDRVDAIHHIVVLAQIVVVGI